MQSPRQGKPQAAVAVAEKTAGQLQALSKLRPRLAIVLGTGFHAIAGRVKPAAEIPYSDLAGFASTAVAGHDGKLLVGHLGACPVYVLSGRSHYYEGHSLEQVTFPVRALAAAGVSDLLLTNAAGGINTRFKPGDFMMVTDHINLMGANPLRGWNSRPANQRTSSVFTSGPSSLFVDLSTAYDPRLRRLLGAAARACNLRLRSGVYLAVSGPSYETPAEIRAFRRLGAAAVGMSTVPEAIVARHCGLRVAALSCITNLAAGVTRNPLSHEEVLETGRRVASVGADLLEQFARFYTTKEDH